MGIFGPLLLRLRSTGIQDEYYHAQRYVVSRDSNAGAHASTLSGLFMEPPNSPAIGRV